MLVAAQDYFNCEVRPLVEPTAKMKWSAWKSHLCFKHSKANSFFGVHAQQQVSDASDGHSSLLTEKMRNGLSTWHILSVLIKYDKSQGDCKQLLLKEKVIEISPSYHAVHENEFKLVLVEGLVAVFVVGRPDVAGDGGCHSGVRVAVARISQKRAFIIEQPMEDLISKNVGITNLDAASVFMPFHQQTVRVTSHKADCKRAERFTT